MEIKLRLRLFQKSSQTCVHMESVFQPYLILDFSCTEETFAAYSNLAWKAQDTGCLETLETVSNLQHDGFRITHISVNCLQA